jgi:3-polyprenyl-4-hydroxybenzoate decarboxylase
MALTVAKDKTPINRATTPVSAKGVRSLPVSGRSVTTSGMVVVPGSVDVLVTVEAGTDVDEDEVDGGTTVVVTEEDVVVDGSVVVVELVVRVVVLVLLDEVEVVGGSVVVEVPSSKHRITWLLSCSE